MCVDCVTVADCAEEHSCVDYVCRPRCDSDRDCVASGLLCDRDMGYCVECLTHDGCKAGVCAPNQPACDGNAAKVCNGNGSGYVSAGTPCGTDVCASGACKPPVCASAERKCQSEDVYECASDRLSWTLKQA